MSKLLIEENPIIVLPSLAKKVGLTEAIILQQIHYWLQKSNHERDGRKWVYNTYKEWQVQIPFWSESTIKRAIRSLEDQGYLLSANYNRLKLDKTKWYSIDYEKLEELEIDQQVNKVSPAGHNETSTDSDLPIEEDSVTQAIPEITTETTTENNNKLSIPFSDIITYLNNKTNSSYKTGTKKTKDLITARWKEGFRYYDFIRVINTKTEEWKNDLNWSKYLRPETLFGTKFESYINQKNSKRRYLEEDFNLDDD